MISLFEESIESYDRALEIDPNLADAWYGKSIVLHNQLNRDNEALETLDKALQIDPTNPIYWRAKEEFYSFQAGTTIP
jgi:hypothetical protein